MISPANLLPVFRGKEQFVSSFGVISLVISRLAIHSNLLVKTMTEDCQMLKTAAYDSWKQVRIDHGLQNDSEIAWFLLQQ